MPNSVQKFIQAYSPESETQISFDWNGKHAAEFIDTNMCFREQVCDYFLENKDTLPLSLIAALYNAETLFAKEAWGVNSVVSDLAQELLERGGTDYLQIYVAGASRCMDTFMESGNIRLSPKRCHEFIEFCTERTLSSSSAETNSWVTFAGRFSNLLKLT